MPNILPATALATTKFMPVVHDLDRQYRPQSPLGAFDLAEAMSAQLDSKAFRALVSRAWDVRDAITQTITQIEQGAIPSLLDLDPSDIAELTRDIASSRAATLLDPVGYSPARRAHEALQDRLEADLKAALPAFADLLVETLRSSFDSHAEVIVGAFEVGITQDTNPAELAVNGSPEQIEAFRALPRAVAGLDQIKRLRDSLTMTLPYGPRDALGLAYVGPVTRPADLDTAISRSEDEVEYAQYDMHGAGTMPIKVATERIGGRWLHMVAAGLSLRLNTAAEVAALRTTKAAA